MEQIKQFENMPVQNVGTFNKIFKSTPLLQVDENLPVTIGEVAPGDERVLYVGDVKLTMCIIQRKSHSKRRKKYNVVAFETKECTRCRESKDFSQFYKHASSKGGVRAECKSCYVKLVMDWKKRNKKS